MEFLMTKPMYCPMSMHTFIVNTENSTQRMPSMQKCIPDCAWAVEWDDKYCCAIAYNAAATDANMRPLKDDEE